MANEIVKMVAKKANISESVAQIAVDTVLKLLKDKLPAGLGTTIDSFLGSAAPASINSKSTVKSVKKTATGVKKTTKSVQKSDNPLGDLSSIAGAIEGLFGKK